MNHKGQSSDTPPSAPQAHPPSAQESSSETAAQIPSQQGSLLQLMKLFLRMGFTAFGGPAAHIAMFHDEVVKRRQWITDQYFLDMLGVTNLIPGPNSTEMTMHIGYVRAGWRGMMVAGGLIGVIAQLIQSGSLGG